MPTICPGVRFLRDCRQGPRRQAASARSLAVSPPTVPACAGLPALAAVSHRGRMTKARVIAVVEDDDLFREQLCDTLEEQGFYALGFRSTGDALRHLQRLEKGAALVLLDLVMEAPDGWQMLRTMKRDLQLRHLPVVVMTAAHEQEPVVRAAGAEGFLAKPFEPEALLAEAERHCARLRPPSRNGAAIG